MPCLIIHYKYLLNDQEYMFKNHALESCIEGFVTVKECSKELDRNTLKRAETSKPGALTLSSPLRALSLAVASSPTRRGEYGGEQHSRESVLLAMASCLLAVASYDSPDLHKWGF
jgi:hypothetical protein